MKVLVTGGAGFIGSHLIKRLIEGGDQVVCVDNFNDYYDIGLKRDRIKIFLGKFDFPVYEINLDNYKALENIFENNKIDAVCNLAAQPGVRFYFARTDAYQTYKESNLDGFVNLLELSKKYQVKNFVYASTSSVYGDSQEFPLREDLPTDKPLSLYAATKKSNEVLAHTYSHLFNLPTTGLRFFNVYGPWGRPDGVYYIWTKNILKNKPIQVFGHGEQERDWTYVDDIITGVAKVIHKPQPYAMYNIGRGKPEKLMDFLRYTEKYLGKKAQTEMMPLQPGEVQKTYCSEENLKKDFGYQPQVNIKQGIKEFIEWYRGYYHI